MGFEGFDDAMEHFCRINPKDKQIEIIRDFSEAFNSTDTIPISDLLEKTEWGKNVKNCITNTAMNIAYGSDEKSIKNLFRILNDYSFESVFSKVVIINTLYSTRLNNSCNGNVISMREMAQHIINCKDSIIEIKPEEGLYEKIPDLVKRIGDSSNFKCIRNDITYSAYSFASKYLSFVFLEKGDFVPITDSYARATLQRMSFGSEHKNIEIYKNYYARIYELRQTYQEVGENISFKEIDAFLWIMGKAFSNINE